MNKKEKYINYIVDDLVKKTEIDFDRYVIIYPFLPSHPSPIPFISHPSFLFFSSYSIPLSRHLKERYGVHDEELEMIWELYKDRIESLIKKI